jgi:hypothetical protein
MSIIQLSISTMLTERHVGLNQRVKISSDRLGGVNRLLLPTRPNIFMSEIFVRCDSESVPQWFCLDFFALANVRPPASKGSCT